MEILSRSVAELKGVGKAVQDKLLTLEIITIQDLLLHLPRKYVDKTRIVPIANLLAGDFAVTQGLVSVSRISFIKGKRNLHVRLQDKNAFLELTFFYFNKTLADRFEVGKQVRCFGEVRVRNNIKHMAHPEFTIFQEDEIVPVETTLTPIYPMAKGVSQNLLIGLIKQVFSLLQPIAAMIEIFPASILQKYQMMDLFAALEVLHFPNPEQSVAKLTAGEHPAQQRIIFEELLAHTLALQNKKAYDKLRFAPQIDNSQELLSQFLVSLPFKLTNAQVNALHVIGEDLQQNKPMLRLVQGDVGSGKTIVAICAVLMVIESGLQVAFMAPTEILAQQHYQIIDSLLGKLGINVVFLCSKLKASIKRQALSQLANGEAAIAVGTHALFQEQVQFKNLGLMIVDEQHRFGVEQRLALQNKGTLDNMTVHQLTMTATPIPRSLAMTMYGDLDYTVIDEMPRGRIPIKTLMVSQQRRVEVLQMVQKLCATKSQIYWVCTLIEENLTLEAEAVLTTVVELQQQLPQLTIGLVHGRMSGEEKEQTMQLFKSGMINVLVATTVIEVGVDVPNASLMVIENPERLGLSQLHQLRGRVGRGSLESFCVLLYGSNISRAGLEKLQIIKNTLDGFIIAEEDLRLRGAGELLGRRQTGLPSYKVADLVRDKAMLPSVQELAQKLARENPELANALINKWIKTKLEYAQV